MKRTRRSDSQPSRKTSSRRGRTTKAGPNTGARRAKKGKTTRGAKGRKSAAGNTQQDEPRKRARRRKQPAAPTRRTKATRERADASVTPPSEPRSVAFDWGEDPFGNRREEPTKRAKDNRDAWADVQRRGLKSSEAVAKTQRRQFFRHTQRKSRSQPLTKSAVRSRGNADTRRRKESRG